MLGKRLKLLREEKDMSQNDLAEVFGISRFAIIKYERNEREADYKTLCMMADYFSCTLDYLLDRSDYRTEEEIIKSACFNQLEAMYNVSEQEIKLALDFIKQVKGLTDSLLSSNPLK